MFTSYCRYQYNPSEQYQRAKPGQGVETVCGSATYPAADEPELIPVRTGDGTQYRPSGRYLPRDQADPYCPAHGGSPEPPPPPVSVDELERAYGDYLAMTQRFAEQHGGALAVPVTPPAQLEARATPADELQAAVEEAGRQYEAAVAAAAAGMPGGEA